MRVLLFLSACIGLVASDALTASGKKAVLSNHNGYRKSIAEGKEKSADGKQMPTATNMNRLRYDTGLESKAQDWASKCQFQHTPNIDYGQNLFMSSEKLSQEAALKQAGDSWWSELKEKFSGNNVAQFNGGGGTGHFTQMAWGVAQKVGCSVQICNFGTFVVCNYDAGNMLSESIYETGKTCSKCPSGMECRDSLCSIACKKNKRKRK